MKFLILFSLFLCVSLASEEEFFNFLQERYIEFKKTSEISSVKRQTVQVSCFDIRCLKRGEACGLVVDCGKACLTAYYTCTSANFNNATNYCNCVRDLAVCAKANPPCIQSIMSSQSACQTSYTSRFPTAGACAGCNDIASLIVPPQSVCPIFTDYCDSATGTCQAKKPNGPCDAAQNNNILTSPCGDGDAFFVFNYQCINGTCGRKPGSSSGGDACSVKADCQNALECAQGICTPVPAGLACSSSSDCAGGLYCANKVCTPQVTEGAACTPQQQCALGLTCGASGTCVQFFSVRAGQPCLGTSECNRGLYCPVGLPNSVCTAVPATPTPCTTEATCTQTYGEDSACLCFGKTTPQCFTGAFPQECDYYPTLDCYKKQGCQSIRPYSGGCGYAACKTQINNLFDCVYSKTYGGLGSCIFYNNDGVSSFVASLFLTVLILLNF